MGAEIGVPFNPEIHCKVCWRELNQPEAELLPPNLDFKPLTTEQIQALPIRKCCG